jgi:hypothetical protein
VAIGGSVIAARVPLKKDLEDSGKGFETMQRIGLTE